MIVATCIYNQKVEIKLQLINNFDIDQIIESNERFYYRIRHHKIIWRMERVQ